MRLTDERTSADISGIALFLPSRCTGDPPTRKNRPLVPNRAPDIGNTSFATTLCCIFGREDFIEMIRKLVLAGAVLATVVLVGSAQEQHPLSPRGMASAQIQGKYVQPQGRGAPALGGQAYEGGKWIDIAYGRPLKRDRDLWGKGADYGKDALVGAPIWRAGSDVSTRLKTEVPLVIHGKTVPVGEYSLFIDLKENNWTLVVSSWGAAPAGNQRTPETLWGAYGYTPDKDVVRTPMKLETLPYTVEQLTWEFLNMTDNGGAMAIRWGNTMASVPFTVGN